ncbi:hypothetical protein M427DRAFT_309576 [Gonapodya prolifera JEL478]|uniref:Uncharacterized protein n=1 Tax=Gonapodya prolifera (strain JEL478) TaxID=1344416 RepID=A0A139AGF3_GONPJ|nr:hypothetical protein M427DRAFT_309576 [Gonapodya prolifera JEL478]|eukprot:KXS15830.1 hypothetical protein M427DRAFT_309576 [Gonapodya prolifera JEL478]
MTDRSSSRERARSCLDPLPSLRSRFLAHARHRQSLVPPRQSDTSTRRHTRGESRGCCRLPVSLTVMPAVRTRIAEALG